MDYNYSCKPHKVATAMLVTSGGVADSYKEEISMSQYTPDTIEIPYGYCYCGCGQKTRVPTTNHRRDGQIKGVPLRYVPGHQIGSRTLEDAFWRRVLTRDIDQCWEFVGASSDGYGRISFQGRLYSAHRVSWQLHNGTDIPEGMVICHTCDNPPCVNPRHLFLGTPADNVRDAISKGRISFGEKHPMAKLSADDVKEIRRLFSNGMSQVEIAKIYGKTQGAISNIIRRKIWKNMP